MSNQLYPSDVTDREWEIIAPFIPAAKTGGRCPTTRMPPGLGGIFFVDRDGAKLVLQTLRHRFMRLRLIWADGGYSGALLDWVRTLRPRNPLRLEIVKRSDDLKGFVVLPRRWVVERTFAWLGLHRRLSKDYETLPATSETLVRVAMIRLMLVRLA